MPADQKEGKGHSQSKPERSDQTVHPNEQNTQEYREHQGITQEQAFFFDLFAKLSDSLLVDLQEYLQLLIDTPVTKDEKELFSAHKNDQEQAEKIKEKIDEIKNNKNNDSLVKNCLDYFKYRLAIYGGEATFDSYILVEKHPLWFSIKYLLTSAANRQYLSKEDSEAVLVFYQNWQQSKDKAIDQELYQELGEKNELRNSIIRDVLSPFRLREFFVGSQGENGKSRATQLLKKMAKLSKKSEELTNILQDENLADSAKFRKWLELAQQQPKLKVPPEVKKVVSLLDQIENFEVASEKRRKLHKKLALLQLLALAFPAIPKLIEYSESLAWQVVGLVPSELRMEAYSTILEQIHLFTSQVASEKSDDDDTGAGIGNITTVVSDDRLIFTAEQVEELQGLYTLENPEYQGIRSLFSTAYEYAQQHGIELNDIYWQRNEEFVTLQNIVEANFLISDRDEDSFLSEEQEELYELSGYGFDSIDSVQQIVSIIHGHDLTPEQVNWYYHDYYNFVFQRYAETGERVDIGEIIGFALVRNNGSLNLALWDTAIFLKLLTRNDATDFSFSGHSPVSGIAITELIQEPFIASYTTKDIVAILGEDNLRYWNFAIDQGNKDFDPANRNGISYHILFLLALADRFQLSLLIGGVADEARNFATSGEYGENKVNEQVLYIGAELGVFGEILTAAESNVVSHSESEPEADSVIYTTEVDNVLGLFSDPQLKSEIQNQLAQGYIVTFQEGDTTLYVRLFGSSISSYVVLTNNQQLLSQPLSISQLAEASPFFNTQLIYTSSEQSTSLEPSPQVVDFNSIPQTVVFTTILDVLTVDKAGTHELSPPLMNYLQDNKQAFTQFIRAIGWERLHYSSVAEILTLVWDDIPADERHEIVFTYAPDLIRGYSMIEQLLTREELYSIYASQIEFQEDIFWSVIDNPTFYIPLLGSLNNGSSGLPFAGEDFNSRLISYRARDILLQYYQWEEVFTPEEMLSSLMESESHDVIFEFLPLFTPFIDKAYFDEMLVRDPYLVLTNLDGVDLGLIYVDDIPQQALLSDMQRLIPEEYLYYVAANLTFFEPLLYVEENGNLLPTPLLLDMVRDRDGVFFRNLALNRDSVLHEIFTYEYVQQLFSEEELPGVLVRSPEYFVQFLDHDQAVDLLLFEPEAFVYEYQNGFDTLIEQSEVVNILLENKLEQVLLANPYGLLESVDRTTLESILINQENITIFLDNFSYGWVEIIPEEELLPLLKSVSQTTGISWVRSVVVVAPYVFKTHFEDEGFIEELVNTDAQTVAEAFYEGDLGEFLTPSQAQKVETLLQGLE